MSGARFVAGALVLLAAACGADEPAPPALTGTIVFAERDGCRLQTLDLPALSTGSPGPATGCELWISPRATYAVASGPAPGGSAGRPIWLVRLGYPPTLVRRLGVARGEVDWSPAGDRLAWCERDGTTVVLALAGGGATERLPGCNPRFTPAGVVLTRSEDPSRRHLLADGDVRLYELELQAALSPALQEGEAPITVLGYDERPDGLLAVVVEWSAGGLHGTLLELWRGTRLEGALPLPELEQPGGGRRFGEVVRFSPGGRELAVAARGGGVPVMLVEVGLLEAVLPPTVQHGFAWSPDGRWFALARDDEIEVLGPDRDGPADVLPVAARSLAWAD